MPTKIFSLTAMSFELRCQCPFVTPASLNGNGCAAAAPTARTVDVSNKLASNVVFIKPSLLNRYAVEPAFRLLLVRPPLAGQGGEGTIDHKRYQFAARCESVVPPQCQVAGELPPSLPRLRARQLHLARRVFSLSRLWGRLKAARDAIAVRLQGRRGWAGFIQKALC